ncbi:MAG: hypothetical protein KGM93_15310 [Sphingomonadales bacterium]|nr:hypothetical protein [Sphingomonadales bacterium]
MRRQGLLCEAVRREEMRRKTLFREALRCQALRGKALTLTKALPHGVGGVVNPSPTQLYADSPWQ